MSAAPESSLNQAPFQAIIPGYCMVVPFTNSAADTPIFEADTTIIEVFPTQDCWVLMKESDSSDSAAIPANSTKTYSKFLAGGITNFLGIPIDRSKTYRLSVIRNTVSGNLYITEGSEA